MNVREIYEKCADWFDAHRSKRLMERKYLDLIIQALPVKGTVLDLGCGSGEPIAKYFIEQGFVLTGIDSSQRMIQLCQHRFPHATFHCADMRTLALRQQFDAILAWDSFFHLTHQEQRHMFFVFQNHIKPKGLLLFTSGTSHGEVFGEMESHALYHASLAPEEYQKLLQQHHFKVIHHQVEDPSCGNHTVWVATSVS